MTETGTISEPGASQSRGWKSLFSFSALLLAGLAVVACLTVSGRFNDPDLWWHLRTGEIIWTTHSVPTIDTFSFTTNNHVWINHEWLAQAVIYGAYRLGGYSGLMVWLCVVSSLIFLGVYRLCGDYTGSSLAAFLGALVAWLFSTVGLAIRPLLLGNLFLVVELLLLEAGLRRNRRWLWLLPPLFLLWVNSHASFLFGIAVLAVYWIASGWNGAWGAITASRIDSVTRRTLLAASLLSCAVLAVNPIGFSLLTYPIDALFVHTTGVNAIAEWMPPALNDPRTLAMLGVMAAVAVFAARRRVAIEARLGILLALTFLFALQHIRMEFLFGIFAAPTLAAFLGPELGEDRSKDQPTANALLIAGCIAAIVIAFPGRGTIEGQIRKTSPVDAVAFARKAGLPGPMLNEFVFGGYLIWNWRDQKVFVDGRADVFDWAGVLQEYGRWTTLAEDPALLLDKYHIRLCLLGAASPMASVMPHLPGWRRVYADPVAVVFVR